MNVRVMNLSIGLLGSMKNLERVLDLINIPLTKEQEKMFLKFINGSRWFKMVQDVNETS